MFKTFFFIVNIILLSANLSAQLSREQLEKDRLDIIRQIETSQQKLETAKTNKESLFSEINALETQILSREKLVVNLQQETVLVSEEITADEEAKEDLSIETGNTLDDYYELLRVSYRNKLLQQNASAFWSSEKILEALTKFRIFKTYENMLISKGLALQQMDEESLALTDNIKKNTISQSNLLEQEQVNLRDLKLKKAALIEKAKSLTFQEKSIQDQLSKQRNEREKFNQQIEQTIRTATSNYIAPAVSSTSDHSTVAYSKRFESKRGFLPWPMSSPKVVKRYGPQPHPSIAGITINSNGIDLSSASSTVSSIFNGEVISVSTINGQGSAVIVQHDNNYYTVYSNLSATSVSEGQQLTQDQQLGTALSVSLGQTQMHFEIWQGEKTLNPNHWLKNN